MAGQVLQLNRDGLAVNFEESIRKEFGKYLKKARKRADVTQQEIAARCGYKNAQFISNIERGTCWPPTLVLKEMSDRYGVSKTELLDKLVYYRRQSWASELGLAARSRFRKSVR